MVTIRRLHYGEGDLFKQLRLASLRDAPAAFASTYESAIQRSDTSWHTQADSTTHGSDRATFIAFADERPIGIAALYRVEDHIDSGELIQMWVHPDDRGTTVARDLLDGLFAWASANHFLLIRACVTSTNMRAYTFYQNYGFVKDHTVAPHPAQWCLIKAVEPDDVQPSP